GDKDQLFQRQPERLLIESARRISDGRKLQSEADTNFRRAEGGAVGGSGEGGLSAAGQGEGSPGTRAASSGETAASADRRWESSGGGRSGRRTVWSPPGIVSGFPAGLRG